MRSTDGLRPKIGRPVQPADSLSPAQRAESTVVPLQRTKNTLPAKRLGRTSVSEEKLPAPDSKPAFGLNRGAPKSNPEKQTGEDDIDWDKVFSILKFLILPAIFALSIVVVGVQLPKVALYGVAAVIGLAAMVRSQRDPEILLALMIIYIPFAHLYAISIAPLVNGTNIFILLCLFTGLNTTRSKGEPTFKAKPGFILIVTWFVLSSASILTLVRTPGALSYTLGEELTQYTAWLSQFGFYLAVYSLIRNKGQAKRAMVYVMFGTVIVVLYGLRESIDKSGMSSIEKMRLGGVFEQPNDFGGFIAYTFIPFIALFIFNMGKIKAWVMAPYFLITLKVLITTFSRGAYVAIAVGGLVLGWLRGRVFLFGWAAFALVLVAIFPQVLPSSVLDRIDQTGRSSRVEKLDKSSEDRLILWSAAAEMTLESPITGKGFKAFPYLKSQYTEIPVREADPHNMYLYISSQMGIPTLLLFLAMMAHTGWMGVRVFMSSKDSFEQVIGASMAAVIPCIAFINLFGSRMVGMSYVGYFYTLVVIVQVLYSPHKGVKQDASLGYREGSGPNVQVGYAHDDPAQSAGDNTRKTLIKRVLR